MADRICTNDIDLIDVLRNGTVTPSNDPLGRRMGVINIEHTAASDGKRWWVAAAPSGLRRLAAAATELADRLEAEAGDG